MSETQTSFTPPTPEPKILRVRFAHPIQKGIGEHMWIQVQSESEDEVTGILVNDPAVVKTVKRGDVVTVKRSDIDAPDKVE
jgi:uncharacterized protein YegJ (DUF2314 family)